MWPPEHLAVGYLMYSLWTRLDGRRPTDRAALALALATQFPDLVDKPLAWGLGVLPTGRTLAHSAFAAVAVVAVVAAVDRTYWRTHPPVTVAVAVGYGSHLLGDVVYPALTSGRPAPGFLLWPLVAAPGEVTDGAAHLLALLASFVDFVATPLGTAYLVAEVVLLCGTTLLWIADDTPGLRPFVRRLLARPAPHDDPR